VNTKALSTPSALKTSSSSRPRIRAAVGSIVEAGENDQHIMDRDML
jgi:hypothetical protein